MDSLKAKKVDIEPPTDDSEQKILLDYWRAKRGARAFPACCYIDPVELPPRILPNIAIVSLERFENEDDHFSCRLVRTNVVWHFGADVTGRSFEDIFLTPDELRAERSHYSHVLKNREIRFVSARLYIPGREFLSSTRMLLPLASDGQTIDMILSLGFLLAYHAACWARLAAVGSSFNRGVTFSANNRIFRSASEPGMPAYPNTPTKPSAPVRSLISRRRS